MHAFRHSVATTIATHAPDAIAQAAPLLTHADDRSTQRYYNTARSLEAGRTHTATIEALQRRLACHNRPPKRAT